MWAPTPQLKPFYLSYDHAVMWPRPVFSPTRTVTCTTQAQLTSAISGLTGGDFVDCRTPGGFAVSGELTIAKTPASLCVFDFGQSTNAVRFNYGGTANLPSVWVNACSNITFYGGDITNPNGGPGILLYGPQNVNWWDFYSHDCGTHGISGLTVTRAVSNCSFKGVTFNCGKNLTYDTHPEVGTGVHSSIWADSGSGNTFTNVQIAIDTYSQPHGVGVEIGQPNTNAISGVTIYHRADHLNFAAVTQVAGNGFQPWGSAAMSVVVELLQVTNSQGRALERSGAGGTSMAGITVKHGRAHTDCLNQSGMISAGLSNTTNPFDPSGPGPIVYQDCVVV